MLDVQHRSLHGLIPEILLKEILLTCINMEEIKTCTQCNQSMSIVNFQKYKTPRKDGTARYGTWSILCKANYNNDYMKRRREDPVCREKEIAYHKNHKRNATATIASKSESFAQQFLI